MGRSAWNTASRTTVWVDDGVEGLPPGMAGGRYRCRACGEPLILKGARQNAKVQPHFAHRGNDSCSRPEQEASLDAADEVVIRLREQIRALPGITHCATASPGEDPENPSGLPPAILAQCGTTTVVIEAPSGLPGQEAIRRRIRAVRDEHAGAAHVWFLKRDLGQFQQLPPHSVRLRGQKVLHEQVAPNERQQAINEAGGHVYWLDGKAVLVPYGIRLFQHPVRRGQDWANWDWRSDPREDWLISKPRPASDAHTWGLVPVAFVSLTRTQGAFRPADAHQVMDDLYAAQERRFTWRNEHAREVYAAARATPHAEPEGDVAAPAPQAPASAPAPTPAPDAGAEGAELRPDAAPAPETRRPPQQQAGTAPPAQAGKPTGAVLPERPTAPPPPPPVAPPRVTAPPAPRLWQRLVDFARRR
ncbi:competence protein CoiA family protein [Streptomyces sp. NPDC091416]|uniref:competence protein CoiA family protein n=1 Tax=Streptomyces sp. NPDC091416 TaxID=3366003 RepID=UPI00381AED5B